MKDSLDGDTAPRPLPAGVLTDHRHVHRLHGSFTEGCKHHLCEPAPGRHTPRQRAAVSVGAAPVWTSYSPVRWVKESEVPYSVLLGKHLEADPGGLAEGRCKQFAVSPATLPLPYLAHAHTWGEEREKKENKARKLLSYRKHTDIQPCPHR